MDVILRSPLLRKTFEGRGAVSDLYRMLFRRFGEVEITDELGDGDVTAFYWRGRVAGRTIEGADFVRLGADGKVLEIRVLMRPFVNLVWFTVAMTPTLAADRLRQWRRDLAPAPRRG